MVKSKSTDNDNMEVMTINENEKICCICLETITDAKLETWITMKCCKQNLHKNCLILWILCKKSNRMCPICRQQVRLNEYRGIDLQEVLPNIHLIMDPDIQHINHILKDEFDVIVQELQDHTNHNNCPNILKFLLGSVLVTTILLSIVLGFMRIAVITN